MKNIAGLALCLSLLACDSDGGGVAGPGDCAVVTQNRHLHERLLDRYYWYRQLPRDVEYERFDSPRETLEFLRYANLDRFSYIASQEAFEDLFQDGSFIGYGFGYAIEDDFAAVRFVYSSSPAADAGLRRGDRILAINGQAVADINAAQGWGEVFGPSQAGLPLSLRLRRKSGQLETLQMNKDRVFVNAVLHSEVIDNGTNLIGYLVFNSFLGTSSIELEAVFAEFKLRGVDRLILDLRYNGGGSLGVARDLASYIRSAVANNEQFLELRYNDKHQPDNFRYHYRLLENSLALDQVAVITSEATCSASEQLVSGLQPYLGQVVTIGSATCGKPVGMNPENFCDSTLVAVNFSSFNADGQGEYFDGIPADCAAADDPGFDFGDADEPMLRAARHFIDNQACPAASRSRESPAHGLEGLQLVVGAV